MKEKRTYRRFDGIAILAVFGCFGMLLFESFFIFEVYDRDIASQIPFFSSPAETAEPAVEKVEEPVPVPVKADVPVNEEAPKPTEVSPVG